MLIAVLVHSSRFSQSDAQSAVAAVARQLRCHVGPAWGRHPVPVILYADPRLIPAGAALLGVFDDADQAGALGYHAETPDGEPYAKVFVSPVLDNGGAALAGPLTVSSVLSHEVAELFIDPAANLWADADGGTAFAVEVCDPVESSSYAVGGVSVSDFVFPEWFDPQAPPSACFNQTKSLVAPFTMASGGYVISLTEGIVASSFASDYPAWRRETKEFPASRTARRLARAG